MNVLITHLHLDYPAGSDTYTLCSGKRYARRLTSDELVAEFERCDPAMGPANRRLAEERYDIGAHVERLVGVYEEAAAAFEPRRLSLPAQEVEVALMALRARLPDRHGAPPSPRM